MNKSQQKRYNIARENFAIGISGGLVAGGGLLAYQMGLSYGWGAIISGIVGIVVCLLIYEMGIRMIKRNTLN